MSDPNIIQAKKPYAISLQTQRFHIPFRAPIDSGKATEFNEQVHADLIALATQGNVNAKGILNYAHTLQRETDSSRQMALGLRKQLEFIQRIHSLQGRRVGLWYDLHDGSMISFVEGSTVSKRAAVSTQYGQATVPMNAAQSKTYAISIVGSREVSALQAITVTTGDFDKGLGDGVVAYEGSGTIEETPTENVANGNNLEYWRRRVIFPLEDDTSEVECEITLTLPDQSSIQANVIYLHPYPLGNVDVTGLWVSPDLSDSFAMVPGFEESEGIGKKRWFFPTRDVAKVKVRLRQRNWHEENGKKVFEYGLQELGIQLVEWDKTYDSDAAQIGDNHTFVTKLVPPDGMLFTRLYGFYSDPMFTREAANNRHLHFVLAKDVEGTEVVWHSDLNPTPQSLGSPIDLGNVEELYLITVMNWAESVSVGSPFLAGCPPFVNGFGIDVTMTEAV